MISFMFGVLGSAIFWVIFCVVGFIVGSGTMKHFAPNAYNYVTKREIGRWDGDRCDPPSMIMMALIHMIFWPLILLWAIFMIILKIIFQGLIGKVLWPLFCRGVELSTAMIPEIEIKVKKEEEK